MSGLLRYWRRCVLYFCVSIPMVSSGAAAPEQMSDGPVWNVTYTRVFPGKMDEYLEQVRLLLIPVLEEDKRQGGVVDYKVIRKMGHHGAEDWNLMLAVEFKSFAKVDGYMARWDAISKRLTVDPKVAQVDRNELRVDVEGDWMQEVVFH
jgi:hypothetical protein